MPAAGSSECAGEGEYLHGPWNHLEGASTHRLQGICPRGSDPVGLGRGQGLALLTSSGDADASGSETSFGEPLA